MVELRYEYAQVGHQADPVDVRRELPVHQRDLQLPLKVRDHAQAPHHDLGAHLLGIVHREAACTLRTVTFGTSFSASAIMDDPLLGAEQECLDGVS